MTNRLSTPVQRRMRLTLAAVAAALAVALGGGCGQPVELLALDMSDDQTVTKGWDGSAWAWAVYSDGSVEQVGTACDWASSNTSVVAVGDPNYWGVDLHALEAGEAVITATYRGVSGTTTITVTDTW